MLRRRKEEEVNSLRFLRVLCVSAVNNIPACIQLKLDHYIECPTVDSLTQL